MIGLKGQVVLITGASSGIGAALAQAISRKGARVSLVARRGSRLEKVAQECPGESLIVVADISKEKDRKKAVQQTLKCWGRIDILVNNAGMGMYGHFMDTSENLWRAIFEINLFSAVFLTQAVLPIMRAQRKGLIINIASIAGLIAHAENVTAYVASKHALVGFSRGLSQDMHTEGIRVLAVCPHLTDTEFFSVSPGAREMAPEIERYRDFLDSPQDVADGILQQLDSDKLVIFPTDKPARAYDRQRDI